MLPCSSVVLNRAWTRKHDDPMTRHCASATAAAIHTNLQSNGGTYIKTNCDPRSSAVPIPSSDVMCVVLLG
jgi:hypothetical protein